MKVAKHETYNPRDGHNDVAILYLQSDVPITGMPIIIKDDAKNLYPTRWQPCRLSSTRQIRLFLPT